MRTQYRINAGKCYIFEQKKNMDTEEEDILVAIYINMVMRLLGIYHLQKDLSYLQEIITTKKDIRNILLLQTALLANDKNEVAKRKPVVGYDSRRGQACNFFKKEALAKVLSGKGAFQ